MREKFQDENLDERSAITELRCHLSDLRRSARDRMKEMRRSSVSSHDRSDNICVRFIGVYKCFMLSVQFAEILAETCAIGK